MMCSTPLDPCETQTHILAVKRTIICPCCDDFGGSPMGQHRPCLGGGGADVAAGRAACVHSAQERVRYCMMKRFDLRAATTRRGCTAAASVLEPTTAHAGAAEAQTNTNQC
eukprot:451720-Pelagomonas_calceolata.AAC.2